ncbi:MAG: four helix bundle protein [Flavobacteriales bacterium]
MDAPHKKLNVCILSMNLVELIYKITKDYPTQEMYGLCSQMRRASISVPSNIAEGDLGRTNRDFKHYLLISLGSLSELDTQIELSFRLGYITENQTQEVQKNDKSNKSINHWTSKIS